MLSGHPRHSCSPAAPVTAPALAQPLDVVDEIAALVSVGSQLGLQLFNDRFQLAVIVVATSQSSPPPTRRRRRPKGFQQKQLDCCRLLPASEIADCSFSRRQFQHHGVPVVASQHLAAHRSSSIDDYRLQLFLSMVPAPRGAGCSIPTQGACPEPAMRVAERHIVVSSTAVLPGEAVRRAAHAALVVSGKKHMGRSCSLWRGMGLSQQ